MIDRDAQLQRLIGLTLRTGVIVSVIIGLTGGLLFLTLHAGEPVSFSKFIGAASPYASPRSIARQISGPNDAGSRGLAIAQIGILCLLMTPVIRVALSIVGFVLERDAIYVVITLVVLGTLTASLLLH